MDGNIDLVLLKIIKDNKKIFKNNISDDTYNKLFSEAEKFYKGNNDRDEINERYFYKEYFKYERQKLKRELLIIVSIITLIFIFVNSLILSNVWNLISIIIYNVLNISLVFLFNIKYNDNVNRNTINSICLNELESDANIV